VKQRFTLITAACILALLVGAIGWQAWDRATAEAEQIGPVGRAVPVEVAAIERGRIELHRTFSGTLESLAEFRVAPKVGGRIEHLAVDLADEVENGAVVATLDSEEYEQAVSQAEADLEVAEANLTEARSAKEIADRAMQRQTVLLERGVASDAQFDSAKADQLAATARVAVAEAQVLRAKSSLQTARIQLGYTQVRASWSEGDNNRLVAERMVEPGDTVAANTPLMSIVELDPIQAVLYVAERDYARLKTGQPVTLRTDAYPGRAFTGEVARVSPVFQSSSRQARVELLVPNEERLLKPGMFIRAEAVLGSVEDATIVPEEAIVMRADRPVVFVIDEATKTAKMLAVERGIANAGRVQVTGDGLTGRVVTLGQQLLDDGSSVMLPEDAEAQAPALEADAG
jgi:RND family efflux transporter MFP subunit